MALRCVPKVSPTRRSELPDPGAGAVVTNRTGMNARDTPLLKQRVYLRKGYFPKVSAPIDHNEQNRSSDQIGYATEGLFHVVRYQMTSTIGMKGPP